MKTGHTITLFVVGLIVGVVVNYLVQQYNNKKLIASLQQSIASLQQPGGHVKSEDQTKLIQEQAQLDLLKSKKII